MYYPKSDLLDAEVVGTPSRVWRAIVDDVQILRQGLIRRIGSGTLTRIWDMSWIPRDGLMLPMGTARVGSPLVLSELIDQMSRSWNMQAVRDFLSPLDWELIESIPLSTSPQDDYYWAWHYEKSGVFSVRSTYRMLVRSWEMLAACAEGRLGRSNVGAQEKKWTELGRTKVPSKVRVFLWRLARHSNPIGDVRHHRNMAADARCGLCGSS